VIAFDVSRAAEADLIEIWLYIAANNEAAADRQLDHLERSFRLLAQQPLMGVDRGGLLQEGVRSFAVDRYLVFYRAQDRVRILRVLHGARDWMALFEDPASGET